MVELGLEIWIKQFYKNQPLNESRLIHALGQSNDWEFQARVFMGYSHNLIVHSLILDSEHSLFDSYHKLLKAYGFELGIMVNTDLKVWLDWVIKVDLLGRGLSSLNPALYRMISIMMKESTPYSENRGILARIKEGLAHG